MKIKDLRFILLIESRRHSRCKRNVTLNLRVAIGWQLSGGSCPGGCWPGGYWPGLIKSRWLRGGVASIRVAIVRVVTVQGGYGPPVGNVRVVINRVANVYGGYCPGVASVRVVQVRVATVRVAHCGWLLSGWHESSWLLSGTR